MPNFAPLAHSFVQTVQSALANDDVITLKRLNVSLKDAEELASLSASEVSRMAKHQFFNVTLNTEALPRFIEHVRIQTKEKKLIDDLIVAGATQPFIARLFRFTPHVMAARRKVLGLPYTGGRQSLPDEVTMQRIYRYWSALEVNTNDRYELSRCIIKTVKALQVEFGHVVHVIDNELPESVEGRKAS